MWRSAMKNRQLLKILRLTLQHPETFFLQEKDPLFISPLNFILSSH
jgi:hypothetical protein